MSLRFREEQFDIKTEMALSARARAIDEMERSVVDERRKVCNTMDSTRLNPLSHEWMPKKKEEPKIDIIPVSQSNAYQRPINEMVHEVNNNTKDQNINSS